MTYAIDLCVGWVKAAEVTSGIFDATVRDNAPGEWSLAGKVGAIVLGAGIDLEDIDTIRVIDDTSTVIFGGYVAPLNSGVSGLERVRNGQAETFALRGVDLWGLLTSRVVYPDPTTDPPWAVGYDQRVGTASTVASGYIRDNLGSTALPDRQVDITINDGLAGQVGAWSARLQPLDQLVARICDEGWVACHPSVTTDGVVAFSFAARRDRSTTCVLSDQGDLTNIRTVVTPAAATYVISGGQGTLEDRTFITAGVAVGAARREKFSDQAALATTTELGQSAAATLAAGATSLHVDAEVTTTGAQHITYLHDYDVGDTIAAQVGGVNYPVPVTSVSIHVEPSKSLVRPLLGTAANNEMKGLLLDVANLQSRFDTQIA